VNPIYAEEITEEQLLNELAMLPAVCSEEDPLFCHTEDEIAAEIRRGMENRENVISAQFNSTSELSTEVIYSYLELALAETGVPTQGDYLRWGFQGYSAQLFRMQKGSQYTYTITYTFTYYTDAEQEQWVTGTVDSILDSFHFTAYTTDLEKVQTIYDYICDNVTYDYTNLNDKEYTRKYTAYAALYDGTAVCQGYATLLYRMLMKEGISARLIPGEGNGGAHGWNIVKLGTVYYDLDATWDTSYKSEGLPYAYFLKCESSFAKHIRDDEYKTDEFLQAYPMAETDYVALAEDMNGDSTVDTKDLVRLMKIMSANATNTKMDINGDSEVNAKDLLYLMKYLTNQMEALY
jgi:transglutaminase-like putative cysteine protease